MKRLLGTTFAALALAGCAADKPFLNDAGQEAPEAVRAECRYDVEKAIVNSRYPTLDRINLTAACLNAKGYRVR